jgi:peptidoglycan/LPS O-acetylase OafA/YrhL
LEEFLLRVRIFSDRFYQRERNIPAGRFALLFRYVREESFALPQRASIHGGRLQGIEGLRALAALAIVVFHVWDEATPGPNRAPIAGDLAANLFGNMRIGVTLFFVLSGFLLYRPFAGAGIRNRERPSVRRYLVNRALRILPAYWVIFLATAFIVDRELLAKPVQFLANLLLVQNYVPQAQPVGWLPLGVAPAWSVVIEVSFYLALPLLAILVVRAARPLDPVSKALAPPLLMLVVGVGSHVAYRAQPQALGQTWEKLLLFNYADWFAVGMFLAVVRILWEDRRLRVPNWWNTSATVAAVVLTAGAAKLWFQGILLWNEYQAIAALAIGLALSVVVLADPRRWFVRVLEWRPLALAGLASYSIFLWNDTVIRALRTHGLQARSATGFIVALAVVLAVVGILSAVTYRYVERPALALKPKRTAAEPSTDAEPFGAALQTDTENERRAPQTATAGVVGRSSPAPGPAPIRRPASAPVARPPNRVRQTSISRLGLGLGLALLCGEVIWVCFVSWVVVLLVS